MKVKTSIVVNGVEYASVDQMPPEIRSRYEKVSAVFADRDGNGIPDVVEGPVGAVADVLKGLPQGAFATSTSVQRWVVNGTEYGSLDDVPEMFGKLVQSMGRGDAPADAAGVSARPAGDAPVRVQLPTTPSASLHFPGTEEPKSSLASLLIGLLVALLALLALRIF